MGMLSPPAASRIALAVLAWSLAVPLGQAQVTVNPRALDELAPPPPAPPAKVSTMPAVAPARRPPQRLPANPDGPHHTLPPLGRVPLGRVPVPAGTLAGKPGTPQKPGAPAVPLAPPPAPVLPPPIVVPTRPLPPPPPAPVSTDAPGAVSKLPSGLRVTFGADHADLNPDTLAAVRALAHAAPPGVDTSFSVTAYAAGTPDDPSTARRLSLSRALVVRSVLMNEGIASVRIYVKALGAAAPSIADGPPDRVDIAMAAGAPGPSTAPTQKAAP
jgi:outer membrane protein OmpA-like peptidoglycan-associated protein